MYEKFYIGTEKSGLQKDVKPFLIPDDAFEKLQNAYNFHGRIRKRFGDRLLTPVAGVTNNYESLTSRLRLKVGTTDANGDLGATITGGSFKIGANFSIKSAADGTIEFFTVTALGTPAVMLTNGASTTHTINTTTGAFVIVGSKAFSDVYYYPSEPVMGFAINEASTVNYEPTYAFDTRFAYEYTNAGWDRLGTAAWTGTNSDFFWSCVYRGATPNDPALFVVNNVVADGIKYYNGAAWATLHPTITAGVTLETALLCTVFHGRLLFFNTTENDGAVKTYRNRCRYSWNGNPLHASAWTEPTNSGKVEIPTQEAIITVQHLRDQIIAYCERSTWELVYLNNTVYPFKWQQINTELGSESTHSQIPFDEAVIAFGDTGIHACNGDSVKRIDERIPDKVFELHNENEGVKRVAGIRDYFSEHAIWSVPSNETTALAVYPDQLLIYSYDKGTWAIFDDTITAFGYIQNGLKKVTWANLTDITWATWTTPWGENGRNILYEARNRNIIAGNQEGFTFLLDPDKSTNCACSMITGITTPVYGEVDVVIKEHNLKVGDYVYVENCQGVTALNDQIVLVQEISTTSSDELTLYHPADITGTYLGGGTITKVSRIDILTKQYNFFSDSENNVAIAKVNFNVDRTDNGEITVDYSTSSTGIMMSDEAVYTGCSLGEPILETSAYDLIPLEASQARLWHPIYIQAEGQCIQLRLYFTDQQMLQKSIVDSNFEWNATIYSAQKTSQGL